MIRLYASVLASLLLLEGFSFFSVNQLMSQIMELCNCIRIFSCLGWIVRFCTNASVLFSLAAWKVKCIAVPEENRQQFS